LCWLLIGCAGDSRFAGEHRREAVHPQIPDRGVVLSGFFRCPLGPPEDDREKEEDGPGRRSSEQAMVPGETFMHHNSIPLRLQPWGIGCPVGGPACSA